jgi:alanyl-tRNA synthetase
MGAMALFGEKYGDSVRVIRFGESVELCGGTHVHATGQIGLFKIISESAIAAGVRRIEAITAEKAETFYKDHLKVIDNIKELVKNPVDPIKGVKNLLEENQKLRSRIDELNAAMCDDLASKLAQETLETNGVRLIVAKLEVDPAMLKDLAFKLAAAADNHLVVLVNVNDGKPGITVSVSDKLVRERGISAGNVVKELAKEIQGGGGGQPHYATAGGKNLKGVDRAIAKAKEMSF